MKQKLSVAIVCMLVCMMVLVACKNDTTTADGNLPTTEVSTSKDEGDTSKSDAESVAEPELSPWDLWCRDLDRSNCLTMKMDVDECELTMDGDAVSLLTTKNADGDQIRIKCENVRLSEDGVGLLLNENSKIYCLDAIPGIKFIDIECNVFDDDAFYIFDAYSLAGRKSIDNYNQLTIANANYISQYESTEISFQSLPNYIYINMLGLGEVKISRLNFYYTGNYTNITSYYMNPDFYSYYIEGDKYDTTRECFDPDNGIFDFYINAVIDSPYLDHNNQNLDIWSVKNIEIGNLHRADGSIKSKNELLEIGDYVDFIHDGMTFNIDPFVLSQAHVYTCYESAKDAYANGIGQLHAVVLPIVFSDQNWTQEDEAEIKAALGRVLEADGTVVEYEGFKGCETVSSYFDKASYGNLNIDSTIVSPLEFKNVYGDYFTFDFGRERNFDEGILETLADWLSNNITDFSLYDQDGNGLVDLLIVTNPGDMTGYDEYYRTGMSLAVEHQQYYGPELARLDGGIGVNYLAFCNLGALHVGYRRGNNEYDIGSLIHEISHTFGIKDYYDLNGVISPIGGLDLMASNNGDWNAFSKYSLGWINPQIVLPSEIEEKGSVQITIDAFETNGDCVVIPTAKSELTDMADTPFCEYMLVDLFTDEGLYSKDAALYGLDGVNAVRVYHVDGRREERTMSKPGGIEYTFSTLHAANAYNVHNRYALTLIQASGSHNLTEEGAGSLEHNVKSSDFFRAGDSFSVEKYDYYFQDGEMNDGSQFPYTIKVKSIENGKAIIEISK